jgi:alpha-amylase/alpha-mannosidase (GH57 family)
MPSIRLLFLWHMHQPFYKDLVTGQYRLPWVRLHGLKDYYGMVKLLDEFPKVHQTFNLVPSLITQLEDYVRGEAMDPFLKIAQKPAVELTAEDRRFALHYLFQANTTNIVGRYPRYKELHGHFSTFNFEPKSAEKSFTTQDFADLQVLSQLAWFDEFFLEDKDVKRLVAKQRNYSPDDQKFVIAKQREILAEVLPAYAQAAQKGAIEISASPFYHPILPLVCDSDAGRASSPGLPLPHERFTHPEDAREQLRRGLQLHERVFGVRPLGVWPSEGSVSDEAIRIAYELGVRWMATDEGVLGRSIGAYFDRQREGVLHPEAAHKLYDIYRYEHDGTEMHMVFRDHSLSDLIGFVYAGMDAKEAAEHFIHNIKLSCEPVLESGKDAVVSVILDGENAWEYFPQSGREFLRRLYQGLQDDESIDCLTVSEAIARHGQANFAPLTQLTPGSWINSNFNIWIGSPEDNRAWDYLSAARDFFAEHADAAKPADRELAYEELLIAEGSDWNWWYGPEHHTENDADFDELYRKHLSNVYIALGARPPEHLAQPIASGQRLGRFTDQTSYIHPTIDGINTGYFDWIGAAHYVADRRNAAMHGKKFLLDAAYAGIDEKNLFLRLDFTSEAFLQESDHEMLAGDFDLSIRIDRISAMTGDGAKSKRENQLELSVVEGKLVKWELAPGAKGTNSSDAVEICLEKILEARIPLNEIHATPGDSLEVRASIWQQGLPVDALPAEGAITLKVLRENEFEAIASEEHWRA